MLMEVERSLSDRHRELAVVGADLAKSRMHVLTQVGGYGHD